MRHTDEEIKQTSFIGITGGVGSGKSEVLKYLRECTSCRVFNADEEAKKLYTPGSPVFERIIAAAGRDILDDGGLPDKARLSEKLFKDRGLREEINSIVHPAVEGLILDAMASERISGKHDYLFVEAALLIECGYEEILHEIWYVYASPETRSKRLRESRGYSAEKIQSMFSSQLSDEEYRRHCARVIDNDGSIGGMKASVDQILKEYNK
ncbi:MAG: dephospho-CoA kinase [Lachnospiraceae bacterium]|nr:dephospho-CoA kinase [Lachnospiraceae bacterium]